MIDPFEPHTTVVGAFTTGLLPQPTVQGSFTAPEDLTLRQVLFSTMPDALSDGNVQVLSLDPDLTLLEPAEVNQQFQLIAVTGNSPKGAEHLTWFRDLAFPLLKGQTLYWGGSGVNDIVQLFFS